MYKFKTTILSFMLLVFFGASIAQAKSSNVIVTHDNFIHADSTRAYLKELAQSNGKVNVVRAVR